MTYRAEAADLFLVTIERRLADPWAPVVATARRVQMEIGAAAIQEVEAERDELRATPARSALCMTPEGTPE